MRTALLSKGLKYCFPFYFIFDSFIYFLSCCFHVFLILQLTSPKILLSNHNSWGPHRYGNGCLVTDKALTPPSSHIVVSWLVGLCLGCCGDWLPVLVALGKIFVPSPQQPAMRWSACPVAVVTTNCVWCIVPLFCIDLCTYWSITVNSQDFIPNQLIWLNLWFS